MSIAQTDNPAPQPSLRLWPGVTAATLLVLLRFIVPIFLPDAMMVGMIGGLVAMLAIWLWWVFFSRAPWLERVGAIVLVAAALVATSRLVHVSIAGAGMGMLFPILALPVMSVALVVWAVASQRLSNAARRGTLVVTMLATCGAFTLLRTGGVSGGGGSDLHWRWTPSPEERLLAQGRDEPKAVLPARTMAKPAGDWPGFRGPDRSGIVHGARVETDWSRFPPAQLWRRPIGPGWSSFAVRGDRCYTQEQRGEDEMVACYSVASGEPVWRHRDSVRFWESNAGPGPRGTPTLSGGRAYAFGATGILNALDADNGTVAWSRNVAKDSNTKVPMWGFASSPLVVGEVVIVAAAGKLAGYDLATGKPRWLGPAHGDSYSSPHLAALDGVRQVLLASAAWVTSVAPDSGALLWEHALPAGTVAIVQPALMADGDVLINATAATGGTGTRRLAVARRAGSWNIQERWASIGLKPYFNDLVVHQGHAFGFDGSILSCIDLKDGRRKWKGGRYGNGQLILLADQDALLVLSENGELALVGATPDEYRELARVPGIKGKTWNHPVLTGDVLLVRNGEEMAAFRLAQASH